MRKTEIVPWTNDWVNSYKKEEKILKDIFLNELIEIHHIGSTSIPTIGYAKPIIDILIVVKDIEKVDLFNDEMRTLGYEPRGENGIAGRRYFQKGKEKRTHHVHIYQAGNEKIKIHLDFKVYLINFPEDAKSYGELKIKLARQFPDEHHKYQYGKQQFVNELVNKVKEWAWK
ncbi:GrpB family protein [Neobacillus cucumis]|uniref:GrpB family protein n=1 Tax=Neobacillus cucumis TaxID=1740721 RepID=UPI00203B7AA5|nr:GrpB family protein [Neobacillus cucumis]MCM3725085.1 GrpB family protein [Neobacillus cucumis]